MGKEKQLEFSFIKDLDTKKMDTIAAENGVIFFDLMDKYRVSKKDRKRIWISAKFVMDQLDTE